METGLPSWPAHPSELLGKRKRRDEAACPVEDDVDIDRCLATYAPLSNLPTPPAPSMASTPLTPPLDAEDVNVRDPAQHLSNLLPQNASLHRLSPTTIAGYLARSQLPQSTVALAACIIDSLSSFFVRTWRKECARLSLAGSNAAAKSVVNHHQRYCGPPKSALIVLAALSIAAGFLDDVRGDSRWWASRVALHAVDAREINATIRCILKDIDYDLLSFTPDVVQDMLLEIFPCPNVEADGSATLSPPASSAPAGVQRTEWADDRSHPQPARLLAVPCLRHLDLSSTVLKAGLPTPEPSPTTEHDGP